MSQFGLECGLTCSGFRHWSWWCWRKHGKKTWTTVLHTTLQIFANGNGFQIGRDALVRLVRGEHCENQHASFLTTHRTLYSIVLVHVCARQVLFFDIFWALTSWRDPWSHSAFLPLRGETHRHVPGPLFPGRPGRPGELRRLQTGAKDAKDATRHRGVFPTYAAGSDWGWAKGSTVAPLDSRKKTARSALVADWWSWSHLPDDRRSECMIISTLYIILHHFT